VVGGSYLALSHITSDGTDPSVMATIQQAYSNASAPAIFRTKSEISMFFAGFELVPPSLADVTRWTPHAMFTAQPPDLRFLAGLGRRILPGGETGLEQTRP